MAGEPVQGGAGPDPGAVVDLAGLARELELLRCRAARGTGKARVSLRVLAERVALPTSTVHAYVNGRILVPADVLDRIVIGLGATPAEQRAWSEAWFRVAERSHARRQEDQPAERAAVPVPRQLPMDAAVFVGRLTELADLDRMLDRLPDRRQARPLESGREAAPAVCVIAGAAGIGKTSLAVRWAHRASDRFPAGQLYADLRGFDHDGAPVDPCVVLGRFLRALGIGSKHVPDDVDERAGLFRSPIADRRLLIVLDNAASEDQARLLLPGAGPNMALVTSRRELSGLVAVNGACSLSLDVLSLAEAMALLETVLPPGRVAAEREAAAELCRLSGRLPLALRVAAGKLIGRPEQPIESWIDELRGDGLTSLEIDGDRQASVRAAFDLSYRALRPGERQLFRLMGLVQGPDLTAPAAGALIGAPEAAAARLLDRLRAVHLVEPAGPGRFRLHCVLRTYAVACCAEEDAGDERRRALCRVFDWYLAMARQAALLLYPDRGLFSGEPPEGVLAGAPPFVDRQGAWAWQEAELANIVAAVEQAHDCGMYRTVWELIDAIRGFFVHRSGYRDDWLATARIGLRAAEQAGDDRALAAMHLNLGTAYWGRGDNRALLEHSTLARQAAQRCRWVEVEARAQANIGHAHIGLGDLERATGALDQALGVQRDLGDLVGISNTLVTLAHTHTKLGDLQTARRLFHEALDCCTCPGERFDAVNGLGWVYGQLDQVSDAERYYRRGLTTAREIGDEAAVAITLAALAEIACRTGNSAEAGDTIRQALALLDELIHPRAQAEVRTSAGRIAARLGSDRAAVEHYRHALEAARRIGDGYCETEVLLGLAHAHLRLGEPDVALDHAELAATRAHGAGYRLLERSSHAARTKIAQALTVKL